MLSLIYNFILGGFFLFCIPKFLIQWIKYKKYRGSILQRLGKIPNFSIKKDGMDIVWIHAVSLGEAKVGLRFLKDFKKKYPRSYIIFTTITKTGQQEVKKHSLVDFSFFLPLDFSWIIKRLVKRVKPDILFLVETDFWLNFLSEVKKTAKVFLINGKISFTSYRRYKKFGWFAKKVFSYFNHIYVQNALYAERFSELGISKNKISITGNLKFDYENKQIDTLFWKEKWGIHSDDIVITIASTHEPEEKLLLKLLSDKWKILLAPRHPERFASIRKLLKGKSNIILVEQMGMLPVCFSLSRVAIIGGSFQKKVGGHNILEPCLYQVPVIFGPYMHTQKDLVDLVLKFNLGYQIPASEIPEKIQSILSDRLFKNGFDKSLAELKNTIQGANHKTISLLEPYLKKVEIK